MKVAIFTKKSNFLFLIITAAVVITVSACRSTQLIITDDMTPQQLIQKGQDAYQNNNYESAKIYYQAAIDRYGSDKAVYIEARYEIGHLYMKQKKYKEAKTVFTEIEQLFRESLPGTLPAAYNKLSEIELQKIPTGKETKQGAEDQLQSNIQAPDTY